MTGGDQNAIALTTGPSTVRGLVINRAGDDGIEVDTGAGGSTVVGNYFGTDVSGTLGVASGYGIGRGISVKSNNVTIGGVTAADRNVVSATTLTSDPTTNHAIGFYSSASYGIVQGNYIGTKADGTGSLANARTGINVLASAANNRIGGTNAGEGNIIANSGDGGVWIRSTAGTAILSSATRSTRTQVWASTSAPRASPRTTRVTPTPAPTTCRTSRC